MASAPIHSKAVVLMLPFHCLILIPLFVDGRGRGGGGGLLSVRPLFCIAVLCVNHLAGEKRADCFTFVGFGMSCHGLVCRL